MLECPCKTSRRLLYEGIRRHNGDIKCNISLSKTEYIAKEEVYRQAARLKLQVQDKGDMMMMMTNPRGTGLVNETRLWLERGQDHVF